MVLLGHQGKQKGSSPHEVHHALDVGLSGTPRMLPASHMNEASPLFQATPQV